MTAEVISDLIAESQRLRQIHRGAWLEVGDCGESEGIVTQMQDDSNREFVSLGYFDPLVARRIVQRFSEHELRFWASNASYLDMASAGICDYDTPVIRVPIFARNNRVELLVHSDDQEKAQKVIDKV